MTLNKKFQILKQICNGFIKIGQILSLPIMKSFAMIHGKVFHRLNETFWIHSIFCDDKVFFFLITVSAWCKPKNKTKNMFTLRPFHIFAVNFPLSNSKLCKMVSINSALWFISSIHDSWNIHEFTKILFINFTLVSNVSIHNRNTLLYVQERDRDRRETCIIHDFGFSDSNTAISFLKRIVHCSL